MSTDHDLAAERTDYRAGSLSDEAITAVGAHRDPLALFARWLDEAFARRESHGDLPEPSAVVLSTVDVFGPVPRPRSRTVLLKEWDEQGFVIYTNLDSAKGRELAADPWAAMLLPWLPLQRQVRIEGRMAPVPEAQSDAYWAQRPRGSQLGAWASRQSQPVASRVELERQLAEVSERFGGEEADTPIPRPPHWGGLRLHPDRIEFWQGRPGRFHDRLAFTRTAADAPWEAARLQP